MPFFLGAEFLKQQQESYVSDSVHDIGYSMPNKKKDNNNARTKMKKKIASTQQ